MNTIKYGSQSRGHADHGWLETHFSFSFAEYFNPERMGFGKLRVLNDDSIESGRGFGEHPHENMEIITIPLSGGLLHQDSEGHAGAVWPGEVQVMSAGTGIRHSEFSAGEDEQGNKATERTSLLQIWVQPDHPGHAPRYEQKSFDVGARSNRWQTLVAPRDAAAGLPDEPLWINQQAYLSRAKIEAGRSLEYELHGPGQGVFAFVIGGKVAIGGQPLGARDALGIADTDTLEVRAETAADVLLIEVPLK